LQVIHNRVRQLDHAAVAARNQPTAFGFEVEYSDLSDERDRFLGLARIHGSSRCCLSVNAGCWPFFASTWASRSRMRAGQLGNLLLVVIAQLDHLQPG
jgi:hypothetical protein